MARCTTCSTGVASLGCAASSRRSGIGSDSTHWRPGTCGSEPGHKQSSGLFVPGERPGGNARACSTRCAGVCDMRRAPAHRVSDGVAVLAPASAATRLKTDGMNRPIDPYSRLGAFACDSCKRSAHARRAAVRRHRQPPEDVSFTGIFLFTVGQRVRRMLLVHQSGDRT